MVENQVKAVFDSLNIEVKRIVRIKTLANYLVRVETKKGNYFLKIYDNKKQGKIGYKLSHLYPLLLKKKIPVPKVLKFDDSLKIIKHPYLITKEIEGEMLCKSIKKMTGNEIVTFYYELGKTIGRIHSITFDKFGETLDGKTVGAFSEIGKGPFSNWKDMHKEIINHRLSYFKGTYFEDMTGLIRKWFKQNNYLIDYNIVPRLLHIDLNQKNIFIKNNKISGIIDFDDAFIGHNEEELMRIEGANFSNEAIRDSFFKGYTKLIKLDENYEARRKYYYLSRLLVHTACLILFGESYVGNVRKEREIVKKEILRVINGELVAFDKNKVNT